MAEKTEDGEKAEGRLETLFLTNVVYQSRDPKSLSTDREVAGFFNARLVHLHSQSQPPTPRSHFAAPVTTNSLSFSAHFECGNLETVVQVDTLEYNLLLQNDTNTRGHIQWFFFRVGRTEQGLRVRFNLVNFVKAKSLFSCGMKVAVYSLKARELHGLGWTRAGEDIKYFRNGLRRKCKTGFTSYYTLSFSYQFMHSGDEVYFAYSIPYTYSRLQHFLTSLEADSSKSQYFPLSFLYRKTLSSTLGGNTCDYLTVTNPCSDDERKGKRGVVFTARTHPGETVGSWVMEGVLESLTEDSQVGRFLRDKFVFRVLPMLNPDGVVNGNYRCGLQGVDLNRCWKKPTKTLHPVEANWKQLCKVFAGKRTIDLVCDLHGHSRKLGCFMYGCTVPGEPQTTRLFPYMCSKVCAAFDYKSCTFSVHPSKESTLRVSLFREMRIPTIYTLETSFCGPLEPRVHFTTADLKSIGKALCHTLALNYTEVDIPESVTVKGGVNRKKAMQELMDSEELLHQGEDMDSSGSDSDPSGDELPLDIRSELLPTKSKKKVKKALKPHYSSRQVLPKSRSPVRLRADLRVAIPPPEPSPDLPFTPGRLSHRTNDSPAIRPYYNIKGKRVKDEITQTPVSFYLSYKLRQQAEGEGKEKAMNEKLQGGIHRIEASINRAKKSLLEDLSLDRFPLQSLTPTVRKPPTIPSLIPGKDSNYELNGTVKPPFTAQPESSQSKTPLSANNSLTPKGRWRLSPERKQSHL